MRVCVEAQRQSPLLASILQGPFLLCPLLQGPFLQSASKNSLLSPIKSRGGWHIAIAIVTKATEVHGFPNCLLRHGSPNSLICHGFPNYLLCHGSLILPGGSPLCPCSAPASRAPAPPPPRWYCYGVEPAVREGGRSVTCMFPFCFLVFLIWSFPVPVLIMLICLQLCLFSLVNCAPL